MTAALAAFGGSACKAIDEALNRISTPRRCETVRTGTATKSARVISAFVAASEIDDKKLHLFAALEMLR